MQGRVCKNTEKQVRSRETTLIAFSKKKRKRKEKEMEVNGEEERISRRGDEDEVKEGYYFLLNTPCSAFNKALEVILQCLGLDSSSSISPSSSEDPETVEETGIMGTDAKLARRRPRQPSSSGTPGQHN